MHAAQALVQKISPDVIDGTAEQISSNYPCLGNSTTRADLLSAHVALAALLQDLGELPFERALEGYYELDSLHREDLANWLETDLGRSSSKTIFTLACLQLIANEASLGKIDMLLVAHLVAPETCQHRDSLSTFHAILNGPLDADRIDYVLRDGSVTIGTVMHPIQILASIEHHDGDKIVINDPTHVAGFLLARNLLYRSVYLEPQKRMREYAMRSIMSMLASQRTPNKDISNHMVPGEIPLATFLQLTDDVVLEMVRAIHDRRRTNQQLRFCAATIMGSGEPGYETIWLTRRAEALDVAEIATVKIVAAPEGELSRVGDISPGKFVTMKSDIAASQQLTALIPELSHSDDTPTLQSILAFVPTSLRQPVRDRIAKAAEDGSLYNALRRQLDDQALGCPADTTEMPGFTGCSIHISWCWDDLKYVRRIIRLLFQARRRYRVLIETFDGIGETPRTNSADVIQTAGAVLVVASVGYMNRWSKFPNGNIAVEVAEIGYRRKRNAHFRVLPVSVDDWSLIEDFPWTQLGFERQTFVGKALRDCTTDDLNELIDTIIKEVG